MRILIIGGGWLGLPLSESLLKIGHEVGITRRSVAGIETIHTLLFDLDIPSTWHCASDFDPEILVMSFPPGKNDDYTEALDQFLSGLNKKIRVIYTSSTGVYKNGDRIDENSKIDETHFAFQTEQIVSKYFKERCMNLRLGGLIDERRHPIHYLAGRKEVANPEGSVNLVHKNDVINAIVKVIAEGEINGLYNIVNPDHPSRKEYYSEMARLLKLAPPEFADDKGLKRSISGDRFMKDFCFDYQYNLYPLK
jgi:nucleoside-diphosphate-sugar epimerase